VEKSATGIRGLDEITQGGLLQGQPTLLCGSAGCGKTLFGMTFLCNGAVEYDEPGVFLAFEELPEDLIKNVGSLDYEVEKLIPRKSLQSITLRSRGQRAPPRSGVFDRWI
jgi:circadian clock protein KaiC